MSSFMNKAKDAVAAAKDAVSNKDNNPNVDNYGTHGSTVNPADSRYDNNPTTGYGNTTGGAHSGQIHPGSTNVGPHSSNVANTVDPRVDSTSGYGNTGYSNTTGGAYGQNHPGSTNVGPHSSNIANKMDPRVDSDVDGRNNPASGYGNTGLGQSGHGMTGNTGYGQTGQGFTGNTGYDNSTTGGAYTTQNHPGSTNVGPHSSNMANKMDPRVDSDLDGRQHPTHAHGATTHAAHQNHPGSTNVGPHSSNLMNKADPRVDSDMDNRNNPNSTFGSNTGGGAHTSDTYSGSTNAGPHSSNLANKLDPRVDSDRDNRNDPTSRVGGYGTQDNYSGSGAMPTSGHSGHTAHPGTHDTATAGAIDAGAYPTSGNTGYGAGNTVGRDSQTTAGPHKSNLMNKLDPRVDSDLDGSKTVGGNKTMY